METYAVFNHSFYSKRPWWMPGSLYGVVTQRSNPRSKEYMLSLLQEKFPQATLVEEANIPEGAKNLILLYSDAIGIGWGGLEKRIQKKSNNIHVLNGRQRYFPLTKAMRSKLLFKRFLEITFLPELLGAPFLILISLIFAIKDILGGRS